MKYATIISLIFIIMTSGSIYEHVKNRAIEELSDMLSYIAFIESEILNMGMTIEMACADAVKFCKGRSVLFSQELCVSLMNNNDSLYIKWKNCFDKVYGDRTFSRRENSILKEAGRAFSMPEGELIKKECELSDKLINECLLERKNRIYNECRVCKCLCFSGAVLAVIILL